MLRCRIAGAVLAGIAISATSVSAAIVPPILEYRLNSATNISGLPAGAIIPNTGTVGAPGDLTMFAAGDPGTTSTNLYSADGLGLSGLPGDRALDNSIAAGMGSNGGYTGTNRGPGATNNAVNGVIAGRTQLTISGWIRTSPGTTWNGLAQIWAGDAGNFMHIRGLDGKMVFQFRTSNTTDMNITGPANWNQENQWMYVGLTWDSTNNGRIEMFYVDDSHQVQSAAVFGGTNGLAGITATANVSNGLDYGLSLGNQSGLRLRPFDGLLDDFRVFDKALTQADLQSVVNADLANQPIPISAAGDFDGDGDVDGADFIAWQTHYPTASGATQATGDANGDGIVDAADFAAWQASFAAASGSGIATVPEPSSLCLLLAAGLALLTTRIARAK